MRIIKFSLIMIILSLSASLLQAQTKVRSIHKFGIAYNIKEYSDLSTGHKSYSFTFRSNAYDRIDVYRTISFNSKKEALLFFNEMRDFFNKYKAEKDIRLASTVVPGALFVTDRKYGIKGLCLYYEDEYFLFANKELNNFVRKVEECR